MLLLFITDQLGGISLSLGSKLQSTAMTLVRGGDLFGLVVHLTHFYSILKLLLVPLVTFTILVVEIAFR